MTHPFHPLFGRSFVEAARSPTWSDERVYFYGSRGRLLSIPIPWTSLVPPDPTLIRGRGRVHFRLTDLLELADFLSSPASPSVPRSGSIRGKENPQ
ncbi:MAG: DUF5372 family protein [Thermoplasmata archaeon]